MRLITEKFVHLVIKEQRFEDETFLQKVITGDESWVYAYDIQTNVRSSQWDGKESSPNVKVMFFRFQWLVVHSLRQCVCSLRIYLSFPSYPPDKALYFFLIPEINISVERTPFWHHSLKALQHISKETLWSKNTAEENMWMERRVIWWGQGRNL